MLLVPDLDTFRILPFDDEGGRVGRLLCDIYTPEHQPFPGCPRLTLKRQIQRARDLGYTMMAGCEVEFFLFEQDAAGQPLHRDPRCRELLRPHPGGQGRGTPPADRAGPRVHGLRGGGRAPRGGAGPARSGLPLRRRAHHRGQHRHLPVRGAQPGQPARLRRVVHAQADHGAGGKRHAHPPEPVQGQAQRLLRSQDRASAVAGGALLRRRAAAARPRLLRHHQSADQQLQAAGARTTRPR